jgi:hypothetical protein
MNIGCVLVSLYSIGLNMNLSDNDQCSGILTELKEYHHKLNMVTFIANKHSCFRCLVIIM